MPARKKAITSTSDVLSPLPVAQVAETKTQKENSNLVRLETLRGKIIQDADELIDLLVAEVRRADLYRQKIEEDEMLRMRKRKQEEEEQNFVLQFAQKKKLAEFEEKLANEQKTFEENKRRYEESLRVREAELAQKEKEYQEVKQEVALFAQKMEKATEEARNGVSAELKKDFENEKRFISQKYDAEMRLLQQQVKSLQQIIQQQEKEVQILREEKTKVIAQINDLAVAVVRGKEASPGTVN